jgi:uncharacterized lipoprotein YmbA
MIMSTLDLKVGDKAVVNSGPPYSRWQRVVEIAKVTPTQYVTSEGKRYRRDDGYMIGCDQTSWRPLLSKITEEVIAALALRDAQTRVNSLYNDKSKTLTLSQFERIEAILKEETTP